MPELSSELRTALNSECATDLEPILTTRKGEDLQALKELLAEPQTMNQDTHRKVLYAAGRWGDPTLVSEIRSALPRLNELGRASAIDALGKLGTPEALEGIRDFTGDASFQVRKFAVLSLVRIGTPEARTELEQMADRDISPHVRELATKQLRRLGQ